MNRQNAPGCPRTISGSRHTGKGAARVFKSCLEGFKRCLEPALKVTKVRVTEIFGDPAAHLIYG